MCIAELNSVAKDLISGRQMIEELQTETEALTDRLKTAMIEQGTEALQGDGWKATWRNVNSSRFDSKSFKQDHADLYSQYSKATTTTRFVLLSSVYEKGRLPNRRPKQMTSDLHHPRRGSTIIIVQLPRFFNQKRRLTNVEYERNY